MFDKRYLLWLIILPICAVGCKKDNGADIDPEEYRPLYDVALAYDELEQGMYAYSRQGYTATEALVAAAQDLESLSSVSNTWFVDSSYINLVMASGLEAVYVLTPVDSVGQPIYRGGGGAGGGEFKMLSATCSNEIANKKILLFNAAFGTSFNAGQVLNNNRDKYNLEINELLGSDCTYDVVTTFGNYGLVVLNTHGLPNGFMLGEKLPVIIKDDLANLEAFAENFNSDAARSIADQLLIDKKLGLALNKKYDPKIPIHQQSYDDADTFSTYIPAKKLAQFNFSNTIIMGNMCYSGFDNTSLLENSNIPILEAFRQANTKTYFGYQQTAGLSMPVNSDFAEKMELRLYEGFFDDGDSTGSVHLDVSGNESSDPIWRMVTHPQIQNFGDLYFKQFFANDYCYDSPCTDTMIDTRDQQVYRTVCIGEQRWMAENLNWAGAGVCFENNGANCDTYGRMYTIFETTGGQAASAGNHVQGICPQGWHVPSRAEVDTLLAFVGGASVGSDKLKADTIWAGSGTGVWEDEYGFAALPAGRGVINANGTNFNGLGNRCEIWTSEVTVSFNENHYLYFSVNNTNSSVSYYGVDSAYYGFHLSCRCIED